MNAFLKIYLGAAVAIDERGIGNTGDVDKSETSSIGILEFSVVGSDVFDESIEINTSSSSTSFPDDSVSVGDLAFSETRIRPRLSCLSRVNVRLRTFRIGATGVVIVSGLCIEETSSSESLSSGASFDPRLGYRN